ncbi:flagellar hook-associated protein FlgK [bacterium SGD-2]|nr:flagellar hook-associated protein FlgK [bacterium SGD-2]
MNLAKMGLGALNAAQYKLKTAAHNVNNAAVEGYNRQTVLTQTAGAQAMGGGYVGRGVEVVTISRSYDSFLFKQLVGALGQGAALTSYANEINQLDTLFADRTVGVSPAIENFFASVNAVASSPNDPAAREEMLGQANNLATQMRETHAYLDRQRTNINAQIGTVVDQINSYVQRIHDANNQIVKARASAMQHEPNDLLDQRDQLLKELNELVGVTVFEQDGKFSLAIGNGHLVLGGDTVFPLQSQPSAADPQRMVVGLVVQQGGDGGNRSIEINESNIRGGKLGGLIQYRQEILDDVQDNLGRLAVGLASAFNEVHGRGTDLHGNVGTDLFSVEGPRVIPATASTSNDSAVQASITNAAELTADNYVVTPRFDADDNFLGYTVTNLTTNYPTDVNPPAAPDTVARVTVDGVDFSFDFFLPNPAPTDFWTVLPTRNAALGLEVEITDPAKIAAAASGTGESNGDIALEMAQLQSKATLGGSAGSGPTMSLTEAFSQIVNRIGVMSQQNKTAGKAQESLIQQTFAAQQQVSGVNLNEEYMKIEEALEQYRAASRLVDVSGIMFDTLLNMR